MKLRSKSKKKDLAGIAGFYAVRPGVIWSGLKQESLAFWSLCIYFFFEYVRPQSLYPVIDILPWAQIALLLSCVTAISDRNIKWVGNSGNALFLLFYALVFLSILFAFSPAASWEKIDVVISWLILYFLIITIINSERRFIMFVLLFFLVNLKMSQYGFRNFVTSGFSRFGVSGSPGWFRDSGDLGIEMAVFLGLSTAFALALKAYWGRLKKLFFYFLPVTAIVTVIATSSRGAQLGVVGMVLWVLLKSRFGLKAIILISIIGYGVYMILPEKMIDEFADSGEDYTSLARLELWSFGMEVVRKFPVLGVGYNNWSDYCNFARPYGIGEYARHCLVPHNTYVSSLAELGITGTVVYLLLIAFIFKANGRTRANARESGNNFIFYCAYGLSGGLVAYVISSFFFSVLFYPIFWVQLALTVALNEISKKRLTEKSGEKVGEGDVTGVPLRVNGR